MNPAQPALSLEVPAALARFLAAMQTPAAYAAVDETVVTVRLVETHVSWVFLTGRFAYKIKKPVRLEFLDYSTPQRRAAACAEELRLNQPHAPELYVDVVPIGGTPACPKVGVSHDVFEHAVRMRQFDSDDELSRLLQANAVTVDDIAALAETIARTQGEAAHADPTGEYGRPERQHRVMLDNFRELERMVDDEPSGLASLRDDLDDVFVRVAPLMARRRETGLVRECHGDLHCGNVVRWQGRLVAFDGLEFDPALRCIDVANDLAFLAMDLDAHARPDLRHALLDAWCHVTGDYAAIELLSYYEPCRALVRAKVAALSRQHSSSTRATVRTYLDWARRHLHRAPPALVVLVGLSGSGKTWLARRLGAACHALHLRSDVERKRLAGLAPLEDSRSSPGGGIYTREFGERTYARLLDCARSCLHGGEHVVVDAANLRRHERLAFMQLAHDSGAQVKLVHCTAPIPTLAERIARRRATGRDASEATVELLERQPSYWEPFTADEERCLHTVDTTDDAAIERIVSEIRRLAAR